MTAAVRRDRSLWVQCACTALVALGAAYASYRHGREFALRFGADETTAAIWPLIVDGLLTTATVELWKTGHGGERWKAWLAFVFGIVLSSLNLIMFSGVRSSCWSAVRGERGDAELDGGVWCRCRVELGEFVLGGREADA